MGTILQVLVRRVRRRINRSRQSISRARHRIDHALRIKNRNAKKQKETPSASNHNHGDPTSLFNEPPEHFSSFLLSEIQALESLEQATIRKTRRSEGPSGPVKLDSFPVPSAPSKGNKAVVRGRLSPVFTTTNFDSKPDLLSPPSCMAESTSTPRKSTRELPDGVPMALAPEKLRDPLVPDTQDSINDDHHEATNPADTSYDEHLIPERPSTPTPPSPILTMSRTSASLDELNSRAADRMLSRRPSSSLPPSSHRSSSSGGTATSVPMSRDPSPSSPSLPSLSLEDMARKIAAERSSSQISSPSNPASPVASTSQWTANTSPMASMFPLRNFESAITGPKGKKKCPDPENRDEEHGAKPNTQANQAGSSSKGRNDSEAGHQSGVKMHARETPGRHARSPSCTTRPGVYSFPPRSIGDKNSKGESGSQLVNSRRIQPVGHGISSAFIIVEPSTKEQGAADQTEDAEERERALRRQDAEATNAERLPKKLNTAMGDLSVDEANRNVSAGTDNDGDLSDGSHYSDQADKQEPFEDITTRSGALPTSSVVYPSPLNHFVSHPDMVYTNPSTMHHGIQSSSRRTHKNLRSLAPSRNSEGMFGRTLRGKENPELAVDPAYERSVPVKPLGTPARSTRVYQFEWGPRR